MGANSLTFFVTLVSFLSSVFGEAVARRLSNFTNPTIPGWHSDPSCIFVPEWDDTFFCATSTFLAFPGLPIYASKDLINWKLVSSAMSRAEQVPNMVTSRTAQQDGFYAPTLRYRGGQFYITASFFDSATGAGGYPNVTILIFTTTDPYESNAWSDPVAVAHPGLDPDIFWDDDGEAYMSFTTEGIQQSTVNLTDGTIGETISIWNGTGGRSVEGPHMYKKDGFYYLLSSEGGTETNHSVTIARSRSVSGPFEGFAGNPILTNKNTNEYFQTVGHADLFQDKVGRWWGMALATRSGPEWGNYPMGRETVLFSVNWGKARWPEMQPVRGRMQAQLPTENTDVPGSGPFVNDADDIDFSSGVPEHFITWRPQVKPLFHASPPERPRALRLTPSRVNLTADNAFSPARDGHPLIGRRQTSTLFEYSVDMTFLPKARDEEAGVTVFLTQYQHMDLSIVNIASTAGDFIPHFRVRVEASGKPGLVIPETEVIPVPRGWLCHPIRLSVSTPDDKTFSFSAASTRDLSGSITLGVASGEIVSGGSGPFTGKRAISPPTRSNLTLPRISSRCVRHEKRWERHHPGLYSSLEVCTSSTEGWRWRHSLSEAGLSSYLILA